MEQVELKTRSGANLIPVLATIPAGWFLMGCEASRDPLSQDLLSQDNERPVHRVWVDEFLLASFQVTNADYARFVDATGSQAAPFSLDPHLNHPQQPVVAVSWFEAFDYCKWLSVTTGRKFRLATEAEWERAARGGREGELYPWGDAAPQALPGYAERCATYWKTGPEPVGQGEANGYRLYNMCDNVHEWCSDWYSFGYYAISPEHNPRGPETGERRSSRGGSWRHHVKMSRCAARSSIPPQFQYADYGFRVACDK
jgi:formylglycine-generating enzyme